MSKSLPGPFQDELRPSGGNFIREVLAPRLRLPDSAWKRDSYASVDRILFPSLFLHPFLLRPFVHSIRLNLFRGTSAQSSLPARNIHGKTTGSVWKYTLVNRVIFGLDENTNFLLGYTFFDFIGPWNNIRGASDHGSTASTSPLFLFWLVIILLIYSVGNRRCTKKMPFILQTTRIL